ncbi:DUF4238 domain-containing protein [Nitrosomonas oligotropha]|uniref:DUF4238 domain-containing protein n=1 Tax=Nitrosomonas oligotropha TaxID=42354 RepID=UPI00136EFE13|nr:DUF4238 domain-containing protein [Nitrosomonas oligotropha]MXS82165.1 DUF4238 domain-containing protein [Nitrosomonas oligotropha]
MTKLPLSHYSPVLANKAWSGAEGYISYTRCTFDSSIKKIPMGKRQWGRKRGLYSWKVERALAENLENHIAPIYQRIMNFNEICEDERIVWSQFLLSQFVRTPTFMEYEKTTCKQLNIEDKTKNDRVGCKECKDLNYIVNRDWYLLIAHKDDYFVRSDNPILISGFIERPETCIFYPLNPKICFVACSMQQDWNAFSHKPKETYGHYLEKGGAHFINFHFARAAKDSLIINPSHVGPIADTMFLEILGLYPQPPFLLHSPQPHEMEEAFESINIIMSATDGLKYPSWTPFELEPFFNRVEKNSNP